MKICLSRLCFTFVLLFGGCTGDRHDKDTPAIRQQLSDPALEQLINNFFGKYKTSPEEGMRYLFGTNKSLTAEQLTMVNSKLTAEINGIGSFYKMEQIMTKKASKSLVLVSCLARHTNRPVRFTFVFYKPKDQWMLHSLKFDDQAPVELLEKGKSYYL